MFVDGDHKNWNAFPHSVLVDPDGEYIGKLHTLLELPDDELVPDGVFYSASPMGPGKGVPETPYDGHKEVVQFGTARPVPLHTPSVPMTQADDEPSTPYEDGMPGGVDPFATRSVPLKLPSRLQLKLPPSCQRGPNAEPKSK